MAIMKSAGAAIAKKGLVGAVTSKVGSVVPGKAGALITKGGETLQALQSLSGGGGGEPAKPGAGGPAPSSQVRNDPLQSRIGMGGMREEKRRRFGGY